MGSKGRVAGIDAVGGVLEKSEGKLRLKAVGEETGNGEKYEHKAKYSPEEEEGGKA